MNWPLPKWLNETVNNYSIFIYENIPYVNFEEQYYGALLLKDKALFNKDLFISTCIESLGENNIKDMYYLFRTMQVIDIQSAELLKSIYEKYSKIDYDNIINNNEITYYRLYLDKYLLKKKIDKNEYTFSLSDQNKPFTDIDLYYYVCGLLELGDKLPTDIIQERALELFNGYGFSVTSDHNNDYVNIYSTYRMIELFLNDVITLNETDLKSIEQYIRSLKNRDGLYNIMNSDETSLEDMFTIKSICFGYAIENIL